MTSLKSLSPVSLEILPGKLCHPCGKTISTFTFEPSFRDWGAVKCDVCHKEFLPFDDRIENEEWFGLSFAIKRVQKTPGKYSNHDEFEITF